MDQGSTTTITLDSSVGNQELVVLSRSRTAGFSPDRFRQARQRARLTQEDLAIGAGLDATTISHWETGQSSPGPRQLARAALVLGKTIGDFLSTPPNSRTLAQLRQQAGFTQADLARLLDMPTTTWAMIERSARRIQPDKVADIAQALDTDPEDLDAAWRRTRDLRQRHAHSARE
jgi:transcriptional regulator with XRE-family HTH domain